MIRIIVIMFACTFSSNLFCQKNLGFEDWNFLAGIEVPSSWSSLNALVLLGNDTSCKKTIDSHSGNFAASLKPIFISSINTKVSGVLVQRASMNFRSDSFKLYYKYFGNDLDSPYLKLDFYKGVINPNNVIGSVVFYFKNNSTWSLASSNIKWKNTEFPDSMEVQILTSNKNKNDSLLVDDFQYINNSKINVLGKINAPNIYYISKSNAIVFDLIYTLNELKKVRIINCIGNEVLMLDTYENIIPLNLISSGIYYIEFTTMGSIYYKKIIISN